jgi:hypothetical protein
MWDGSAWVAATHYPGEAGEPFITPEVQIRNGHTITYSLVGPNPSIGNLDFRDDGSTLNYTQGFITISGDINFLGDNNRISISNGFITLNGNLNLNAPVASGATNELFISGGNISIYNLTSVNSTADDIKSGITIQGGNVIVNDDINMGDIVNRNFITFTGNGALWIEGNFNSGGSFNSNNTGLTRYSGQNAQLVKGYTYHNLILIKASGPPGNKNLTGPVTATGYMTITNSVVNLGNEGNNLTVKGPTTINTFGRLVFEGGASKTVRLEGNLAAAGTIDMTGFAGHNLYLSGATNELGTYLADFATAPRVYYDRNGAQTMFTTQNYQNLIIQNGGVKSLAGDIRTRALVMDQGDISTGAHLLEVGSSPSAAGTLTHTSGNVIGRLKRWRNSNPESDFLFPLVPLQQLIMQPSISTAGSQGAASRLSLLLLIQAIAGCPLPTVMMRLR